MERLQALVDGELDPEIETAVLFHVEACESCLEWFEQVSAARQIPIEIGIDQSGHNTFRRRLMHRINREQTKDATIHLVVTGFAGLLVFVLSLLPSLFKRD
jgi:anti-sigma factor RsiW